MFQNHLSELLSDLIQDVKFYKSLEIKKPMYKLFLTLENEAGIKSERVKEMDSSFNHDAMIETITDMIDDLDFVKEEDSELVDEAKRLVANDKANS